MSNVLIEKKGVAVELKTHITRQKVHSIASLQFSARWGVFVLILLEGARALQHTSRCHTTGWHMHPCIIWAELF